MIIHDWRVHCPRRGARRGVATIIINAICPPGHGNDALVQPDQLKIYFEKAYAQDSSTRIIVPQFEKGAELCFEL